MQDIRQRTITGKPSCCDICGGTLEYKGLGEYYCSNCDHKLYDDYGKVRNFVDDNPTAMIKEIAAATGVSKNRIREFVDQDRFIERRWR